MAGRIGLIKWGMAEFGRTWSIIYCFCIVLRLIYELLTRVEEKQMEELVYIVENTCV
jgi:hypothetical protein